MTLSREKLEEIAELARKANYKPCAVHMTNLITVCDSEVIEEMARRLLAAEAQVDEVAGQAGINPAVAEAYMQGYHDSESRKPAQPVAVPDDATPENVQILASTYAPRGITYQWDRDECNAAADSWNACRAAMLNAEPVSQPYMLPQWIPCSERMPDNGGETYKLYLCWGAYNDDDDAERGHIPAWFVTNPNDGRSEWEPVEDDCNPRKVIITHWMPLPAAPQEPTK